MDPVTTLVSSVATKAASAIGKMLLEKSKTVLIELGEEIHHAFVGAFEEAIKQTYEKHSYFSSIIFPNRQLKLYDYYLPLTLESKNATGGDEGLCIDSYPGSLLANKKDILIVDFAGMGKSTILKYIFLQSVEKNAGIPIFIELRKLSNPGQSIFQNIINQLENGHEKINSSLVARLISSGGFIFFFDGYDEIPEDARSKITSEIIDFKRKANKNIYILSSREMPGLNAFKEFYRYNIKPLEIDEAYNLIKIYSESKKISDDLISKLQLKSSLPILEFLKNPLLVSLLYRAYEYKKSVPLRKHVFYRQVFEALFDNHDLSKDEGALNRPKKTGLDIHSFELVMQAVGYKTFTTSKVEYSKDELIILLESTQKLATPIKFNPQNLLEDLTIAVPLFAIDGTSIRWQHKSLQEYFAALFVSAAGPDFQKKIISSMFASKKASSYLNFLTLFCDIDPRGGRNIIIKSLLNELIEEYEETQDYSHINPILAKHRRILSAGKVHTITTSDIAKELAKPVQHNVYKTESKIDSDKISIAQNKRAMLFQEIVKSVENLNKNHSFQISESIYKHNFPGCLTSIRDRSVFLRKLANAILTEEELDCRFSLKASKDKYELKNMPEYFNANQKTNNTDEIKYFSQINELIYLNTEGNDSYLSFDIDKLIALREKIDKEMDILSSDFPVF